MAAPGENLLSVEHLTCMEQNTFAKQKELFIKERRVYLEDYFSPTTTLSHLSVQTPHATRCSRGMQLQQHLQELKKRECRARQHNRQLLLQFERAQDTLKEMLAHNAAMKIIRMEYERYLEENIHRWQQQLQERKQASQKKFFPQQRMEDSLKSYLQHNKHEVSTGTLDEPLISQESSWLTQADMLPGYLRVPFQSQSPSLFPPPSFPYCHPLLLQHITSPLAHHQPWARPKAADRAPPQYDNPCIDGIPHGSSGQLHTEEPSALRVTQTLEEEDETSVLISKRVRSCQGRRCLSSELDVKPVRLSSGHAESSESSRDSSLTSREKKKREKKGRTKPSSSESERCGSQKSSRSEIVAACCPVALGSETNSSSEEGDKTKSRRRTKRGRGLNIGSTSSEKVAGELNRSEEDEKTDCLGEKVRSPGQDNGSEICRGDDGSGSDLIKSENRGEEMADEEVNSSEQSNTEERDEEEGKKNPGSGDEKTENKLKSEDGDVEEDKENNEVSPSRNQKEQEDMEDEEKDEEQSDKLENDDREKRKQDSASSRNGDEDESEGSEKIEEDEEGSNEEEDQLRSDEAEDSEDSIIFPQENRSKQMKNTPEEAAEDEEENEAQSSNNNSEESSDEENIENLLAPREPTNKKDKTEGKPKAICLNLGIFQVAEDKAKTDHKNDSDEFDHFYD
ncbi:hypothetical protein ATANTOWER_007771 [Ataeniobius toweri]|uniref:Polo-like kinase 1 substrate 1 n=1 Tax=Ataeniobius toweri TaxID=208326 RepID=A0ABU7AYG4_9TELE|nr:hypothetical protein [Ataeniobius toweri]